MKILKRNQFIILIISLMLITAGYLNFTSNDINNTIPTSETIAELGDATLVSSTWVAENENAIEENIIQENAIVENVIEEEVETSKTVEDDNSYFTSSKLERENMYSQILETYQEIYNNENSTAEQKTDALKEISNINNTKNGIMIAENLIYAKGIENVLIFVNTDSISVIIGEEDISDEQIAQVQNIVSRELNVTADKIHISTK